MYQLKKIITAFIMLLLLATPIFFSVLVMVKQQVTQYQRNTRFSKEILQTITVSSADIYWVKPGKEILFKGQLFDVKSFVIKNNSILLTGFFDIKEDKLVQQIVKLALEKNKSGNQLGQPAIKFLFFPGYTKQSEINFEENTWKFISQLYYEFDEKIPVSPSPSLIHPPC
jgi:hypothetical protein